MREFIGMFKTPAIHDFNGLFVENMFKKNMTALIWFRKNEVSPFWEDFHKFAFCNRHKIPIYTCWMDDNICMSLAIIVGLYKRDSDAIYILKNQSTNFSKFKMKYELTRESLQGFFDNFEGGFLSLFMKSETEKEEKQGIIRKVVRTNFHKKVIQDSRDVVLVVYIEGDQQWVELWEIMEKIGLHFISDEKVVIYKLDFGKNEHDKILLKKFPGIQIFLGKQKYKPIIYLGKNSKVGILQFFMDFLSDKTSTEAALNEGNYEGEF